jgi:hypothetical protein
MPQFPSTASEWPLSRADVRIRESAALVGAGGIRVRGGYEDGS